MEFSQNLAELSALSENFMNIVNKDLTSVKFKVLLFIKIYGVCTPKILINKLGIIKTNLASTLRALISEGLVKMTISSADARGREYCLTPEGEKILGNVMNEIENRISISDKLDEFNNALGVILAVLNRKL